MDTGATSKVKSWHSNGLRELAKVMWNTYAPASEQLNFTDDHVLQLQLEVVVTTAGSTYRLYIYVLHAGHNRFFGSRQNEILVLPLEEEVFNGFINNFARAHQTDARKVWYDDLINRYKLQERATINKKEAAKSVRDIVAKASEKEDYLMLHRVSFKEIWNPGNQLGYGWVCACEQGILCPQALTRPLTGSAYVDFVAVAKTKSMFSVAIPFVNGLVLYRFTAIVSEVSDWKGDVQREMIATMSTGVGEVERFFLLDEWNTGTRNPIREIMSLLSNDLMNTAEGMMIKSLTHDYATQKIRSTICHYDKHSIGTNLALEKRLRGPDLRKYQVANAFTMMHMGKCIVCATNDELAFTVPSGV